MLTHIDLFAGIGGFSLAAGWAGFRTVVFCEIDEFCQEVLKARFGAVADPECRRCGQGGEPRGVESVCRGWEDNPMPTAESDRFPILIPDIRNFDGTKWRGATLLTGGFPCQPFSHAGKRRGKADDRAIWPEMRRVIAESRPHWVLAENVSGIISMELDTVLADLEMEGYTCRTFHIGAVAVNAPHRRMRVWIVANRECEAIRGKSTDLEHPERQDKNRSEISWEFGDSTCSQNSFDASSQDSLLGGNGRRSNGDTPRMRRALQTEGPNSDAPDPALLGINGGRGTWRGRPEPPDNSWDTPWPEVATSFCRVDARVSNRVDRLKALGNAVVPQIPFQIIKGIAEIENARS